MNCGDGSGDGNGSGSMLRERMHDGGIVRAFGCAILCQKRDQREYSQQKNRLDWSVCSDLIGQCAAT